MILFSKNNPYVAVNLKFRKRQIWSFERLRLASSRAEYNSALSFSTIPIINPSLAPLAPPGSHIVIKSVLYPFCLCSHCHSCLQLSLFLSPWCTRHLLFIQCLFTVWYAGWNTNPAVWISGPIFFVNDSAMCEVKRVQGYIVGFFSPVIHCVLHTSVIFWTESAFPMIFTGEFSPDSYMQIYLHIYTH